MSTIYRAAPLFGGAIVVNLPVDYVDVSNLREVPSHQEVYIDSKGFTSVIVEILEYACPPEHPCETDEAALKYHYADMVTAGYTIAQTDAEDITKFWSAGEIIMPSLDVRDTDTAKVRQEKQGARVLGIIGTQTPAQDYEWEKTAFTALLATLVRLPAKQTDILITVSVPHTKGEYDASSVRMEEGKWGKLIETVLDIRKEIWRSFEVKDWELFDG